MYSNFAKLLKPYASLFLGPSYSFKNNSQNVAVTPLSKLLNKVIIIVDGTNASFMDCPEFCEYVNMTSSSMNLRCLEYNQVLNTPDLYELQRFNCLSNMTVVIPNIVGGTGENPNSNICQEAGVNFTCMMFNLNDANFQNNMQYFNGKGKAFVLKPTCTSNSSTSSATTVTIPAAIPQTPDVSTAPRTIETSNQVTFQI
jgi:hypothetical protein